MQELGCGGAKTGQSLEATKIPHKPRTDTDMMYRVLAVHSSESADKRLTGQGHEPDEAQVDTAVRCYCQSFRGLGSIFACRQISRNVKRTEDPLRLLSPEPSIA